MLELDQAFIDSRTRYFVDDTTQSKLILFSPAAAEVAAALKTGREVDAEGWDQFVTKSMHQGASAMTNKQIEAVEVARNNDGWFSHPNYLCEPEWEDVDFISDQDFKEYCTKRGIETDVTSMEGDDPDMHERYCNECQGDVSAWEPSIPPGDGWFVLSIHDTEDSPICVWGRKLSETPEVASHD